MEPGRGAVCRGEDLVCDHEAQRLGALFPRTDVLVLALNVDDRRVEGPNAGDLIGPNNLATGLMGDPRGVSGEGKEREEDE